VEELGLLVEGEEGKGAEGKCWVRACSSELGKKWLWEQKFQSRGEWRLWLVLYEERLREERDNGESSNEEGEGKVLWFGFKERGVWATERGSNEGSGWKSGLRVRWPGGGYCLEKIILGFCL
jgi:hypothetical protein